jgi:hypothetical protein
MQNVFHDLFLRKMVYSYVNMIRSFGLIVLYKCL